MKTTVIVLFLILIAYQIMRYIQVLVKMKKKAIFPVEEKDIMAIRRHPVRPVVRPTYKAQKNGVIIYGVFLLFMTALFIYTVSLGNWPLLLTPAISLLYLHNLFNMLTIVKDGLLVGGRFVHWKDIKSFQFKPIDIDHRFYGHTKEVNEAGYELVFKRRLFSSYCIVISEETKDKITEILREYGKVKEEPLKPQEA
ncbi:hypothetical protein [Oceanobacillus picturae]|uniref:hypothetical protein n=1 Tax=Oceanobacillus picturae TaxID=171693 RepID=UPI0036360A55